MTVSDAQAIAILTGAITTAVATLSTLLMSVLSFRAGRRRDLKLDQIHDLTNSLSTARSVAVGEAAFSEGRKAGILTERDDPHANAPPRIEDR